MILRDSTNPFDIPLDGLDAVAGYGDDPWTWSSAGWARFGPHIVPLSIVVSAANAGDILDVERFDATPAEAPGWADRFRRPARRRPTIYCNRSTIAAVRAAMAGRPFDWFASTLDGTLNGTQGAVAVQWKGAALTGGHYDESVILDPSWIGKESDMNPDEHGWLANVNQLVTDLDTGWFTDDGKLSQLLADVAELKTTVAKLVDAAKPVDVAQLAADLVAHLPAGADAQAEAAAVVDHLAQWLQRASQAQVAPPPPLG